MGFGTSALLVVAGAVAVAVLSGGFGQVLGMMLFGLGLVLAVSLVFLEVGLSEDRERAREAQRARERERSRRPQRRPRSRLERIRGRPRRLR